MTQKMFKDYQRHYARNFSNYESPLHVNLNQHQQIPPFVSRSLLLIMKNSINTKTAWGGGGGGEVKLTPLWFFEKCIL